MKIVESDSSDERSPVHVGWPRPRWAAQGVTVTVVDLATIRQFLAPAGPRHEAIVYRALVCASVLLSKLGVAVLIDAAAPRRRWRQLAREQIAHYAEVELVCPAGVCAERARASRWNPPPGALRHDAIDDDLTDALVWESSLNAELALHTDARDVACVTEDILQLAWRLHRAAQSERIRPEETMPCVSAT